MLINPKWSDLNLKKIKLIILNSKEKILKINKEKLVCINHLCEIISIGFYEFNYIKPN